MRNVVIIGGGISSHTAALYTARASLKPLIISGPELDQLSLTTLVENYPGFPEGVQGPDLIANCKKQAQKFGAEYIEGFVDSFKKGNGFYEIGVGKKKYKALSVIISTGASARRLGIPGEDKYFGRGVSTCAVCDAALYKNKVAVVVGGGDAAMEETLALYKFAKKIYLVHRKEEFRASQIMQDRILKLKGDKLKIVYNTEVLEVLGDKLVNGVKVKNNKAGKEEIIKTDGLFLAVGHVPNTKPFDGVVELDKQGFVKTNGVKTNLPGVFAAGDVQDYIYKQAITSAGTGCMAALEAEWYIERVLGK
ncbi:MAG: thioredoxin-disulfide reductase [Candidatus Woesearchaeota archaeon]|nr:MAG: thioredoxin-disulfide reductase [Candidatus Woesearchaeota archaeon]